jgi:hypothetical protein
LPTHPQFHRLLHPNQVFGWKCGARNALSEALNNPHTAVKELGRQKINGIDAAGFQLNSAADGEEVIIWADSRTASPVQIDIRQKETLYTLCNIKFDIPADESLVSMEVPAGYAMQNGEVDMTKFPETDFLTVLQINAEYLNGRFPDSLTIGDLLKLVPELGNLVPRMNLTPEHMREFGNTFARGMMFLQNLAAEKAEWQYTGKGVRLGEAGKAISRYRMPDSQSYRVIFGDLHVADE